METKNLHKEYDYLAPDGSEIRLMSTVDEGSMVHYTLNPGETSGATFNKIVDELWYILEGTGEICEKALQKNRRQL